MRLLLFLILLLCCGAGPVPQSPVRGYVAAAGGGGGDVAWRSTSHVSGTGENATPSEPAGAAENDIMIAVAHCAGSGTLTQPEGWSVLTNGVEAFDGFFDYNVSVIRRGASPPSLTWTTGSSVFREVFIHAFSGAKTTGTALDAIEVMNRNQAASGADPPAVTTVNNNCLVMTAGINWSGGTWAAPANYTIRGNNTGNTCNATRTSLLSASTAEDPETFTGASGGGINWVGFTYGISD